jgi:hypothetical protein
MIFFNSQVVKTLKKLILRKILKNNKIKLNFIFINKVELYFYK